MWKFVTILIYLCTISALSANGSENILFPGKNSEMREKITKYRSIASCIANTCKEELLWKPTVVLKLGANKGNYSQENFVYEMQTQLSAYNVLYIITTEEIVYSTLHEASYLFVHYFEDCDELSQFNFKTLRLNIKYLHIVENYSKDECRSHFEHSDNVVGKYDISFLVNVNGQFKLYTFIPHIDPDTCVHVAKYPKQINVCVNGEFMDKEIFPQKNPTNYKKCPFKVGMGSLQPFAMIENKDSLKNYDILDETRVKGLDYEVVKIMAEYFNATLNLHYVFKEEENPYVNVEFLQFVLNGSLEACAGGLYRIFGDDVEYSGIYARQSVMWIYSAERTIRTWDNMVVSIDGLYLFIVFYFGYTIVWFIIRKFDKHVVSLGNTLLYGWGTMVGTALLQEPRSMKQKILNMVYLNMCLHLSVYISIELFSFFTILDPPQMFKTNEEVMNSGRTAYLQSLTKYFIEDEKYERFANTSTDCDGFADCARLSLIRKGVTVFIQGYFYNFQAITAVNDEARMLRISENLLTVYYEMIIRKDSPLVIKFQKLVVRLFEAGITEKLYEDAVGVTVVGKARIATKNIVSSSYSCQMGCTLSLRQFSGVFIVWIFGCVLSFGLFFMEVMGKRNSHINF